MTARNRVVLGLCRGPCTQHNSEATAWGIRIKVCHGIGGAPFPGNASGCLPHSPRAAALKRKKNCSETAVLQKDRVQLICSNVVGGDWWFALGGDRRLAVGGGWRWLAAGDWWLVAVGSWSSLAVGSCWRLAVGDGWWLANSSVGMAQYFFLSPLPLRTTQVYRWQASATRWRLAPIDGSCRSTDGGC